MSRPAAIARPELRPRPRVRRVRGLMLALLVALFSGTTIAGDDDDHERAYRALKQGKVLPLRGVLQKLERQYRGKVLKVEFEEDDGRYRYEVRLLRGPGEVLELEVDAVSGRVLKEEADD